MGRTTKNRKWEIRDGLRFLCNSQPISFEMTSEWWWWWWWLDLNYFIYLKTEYYRRRPCKISWQQFKICEVYVKNNRESAFFCRIFIYDRFCLNVFPTALCILHSYYLKCHIIPHYSYIILFRLHVIHSRKNTWLMLIGIK